MPATDEVSRLQAGSDPESLHFRKFADQAHSRKPGRSRQGTYVCTPSGILLGSLNRFDPDVVAEMLEQALDRYQALPVAERKLAADADIRPTHRWEESYPADGLDLTMYTRDLPKSGSPLEKPKTDWNQDRVWFSKSEARKLLPADPATLVAGSTYRAPLFFAQRLARFSLIDTVKGQTSHYSTKEVKTAELNVRIENVEENKVTFSLSGKTAAESSSSWRVSTPHGMKTELLGKGVFDLKESRFTQLEIVALGSRWGRTTFNRRYQELEKSPVGFVLRLTPAETHIIAPAFLSAYQANWVIRP